MLPKSSLFELPGGASLARAYGSVGRGKRSATRHPLPQPSKFPNKKITVILFWHCWTYRGNARHNKDETDLPRPVIELECEL
ncbi:hypothetical protein TUM17571_14530 [Klebsiella pneumoniae]|nr:hypothetical protein TUM17557_14530 [Enterobacter cloacae]GJL07145.1 hypothetical protein TUM17571_14530 [Klebsiella pneumoniae]